MEIHKETKIVTEDPDMKTRLFISTTGSLLIFANLACAHHGSSTFDPNKPVTLTGTISKVDWMNPHCIVYFDVKESSGKTATWAVQTNPPNVMTRDGLTREALTPGTAIIAMGLLPRGDGSASAATIPAPPSPSGPGPSASELARSAHLIYGSIHLAAKPSGK